MYFYSYKITNNINNKQYIGVHRTNNLDDGYMGSGVLLKKAQRKYGIENFSKEILKYYLSETEMYNDEKNLIENFKPEYNLHEGGSGGWKYVNENGLCGYIVANERYKNMSQEEKHQINIKKSRPGDLNGMYNSGRFGNLNPMWGKTQSEKCKESVSEANSGKCIVRNTNGEILRVNVNDPRIESGELISINTGKKHTDKTKLKMSEAKKDADISSWTQASVGTKWWNNGIENKREKEHPGEGWKPGRLSFKKKK